MATYQPIAGPGIKLAPQDIKGVFVTHLQVPEPGSYYIAAKYTAGGKESTASGGITFNDDESTPAVGTPAPPSVTPTLKTAGGDATKITTADPPDTSLLEYSVADSLKAKKPFVVVFATPKFCTSRLCGPTVQIVQDVQKRDEGHADALHPPRDLPAATIPNNRARLVGAPSGGCRRSRGCSWSAPTAT